MNLNRNIQPSTEFIVYEPFEMSQNELSRLNDLYLPLIQSETLMTYLHLNQMSLHRSPLTMVRHKEILDSLVMSISEFLTHKDRLEAIGLLKTYQSFKKNEYTNELFIYQILKPVESHVFFNDPMLSLYLFNRVGQTRYRALVEKYSYPELPSTVKEVTKKFTDIFSTRENKPEMESLKLSQKEVSNGAHLDLDDFDFDVLFTHLKGTTIDKSYFTKEIKMLIVKLSVLFNLNAYDMKQILLPSTSQYGGIDQGQLKYEARKYYQRETKKQLSQARFEKVSTLNSEKETQNTSNYADILSSMSPIERVNQLKNYHPSDQDLKLVTDLMTKTELPKGVINILLEYVYQMQDGELIPQYTMTIAKDWDQKGYRSVKDAYDSIMQSKKRREKKFGKTPNWKKSNDTPSSLQQMQSNVQSKEHKKSNEIKTVNRKTAGDDPSLKRLIDDLK